VAAGLELPVVGLDARYGACAVVLETGFDRRRVEEIAQRREVRRCGCSGDREGKWANMSDVREELKLVLEAEDPAQPPIDRLPQRAPLRIIEDPILVEQPGDAARCADLPRPHQEALVEVGLHPGEQLVVAGGVEERLAALHLRRLTQVLLTRAGLLSTLARRFATSLALTPSSARRGSSSSSRPWSFHCSLSHGGLPITNPNHPPLEEHLGRLQLPRKRAQASHRLAHHVPQIALFFCLRL
jgi:hypothetical protein